MKPTKVTITLNEALTERVAGLAALTGQSRATVVEALVERGLNIVMHNMATDLRRSAERARGPAPTSKAQRAG